MSEIALNQPLYGHEQVPAGLIESRLEALRKSLAESIAATNPQFPALTTYRTKATLANVIVLNTAAAAYEREKSINALVGEICFAQPSRMFVLDCNLPENASAHGVATAVSSRCFVADSGIHICTEEIYLSVREAGLPLVSNLLLSLLAPDVDTVLLVVGEGFSEQRPQIRELFTLLSGLADKIIYDSTRLTNYGDTLSGVLQALTLEDVPQVELCDLNWQALRRWRTLIAEGFDAEYFKAHFPTINRVVLQCNQSLSELKQGNLSSEALLIASWVICSLNLEQVPLSMSEISDGRCFALEYADGQTLSLEFVVAETEERSSYHNRLTAVEIYGAHPEFEARLTIKREFSKGTAEVAIGITASESAPAIHSSCEFAARNSTFVDSTQGELIISNIATRRGSGRFNRALRKSLDIARKASDA